MKNLSREEAKELLIEASKLNPGKWVKHSTNVAKISEKLAAQVDLNTDKAYVCGLLHDIGRREGITGIRHSIDGYIYLCSLGYDEVARYCLTHSYYIKNIKYVNAKTDLTEKESIFIQSYLDSVEYDLYDKIIQIADCMCTGEKITSIERRLIEFHLRSGISEITLDKWKAIFKIQDEIEQILKYSIYKLFPEVSEDIQNSLIKDVLFL